MLHQTPATKIPPSPKGAAGTTGLTRQVRYYPTRQLPRSLLIFRTRLGPNVLKLLEFLKKCFFDSTVQLGWETEVLKATGKMLLQPSFTVSENLDSFYKLWISDCSSFWTKPLNFWRLARVQIICWLSLRDSSNEERTCLHSYDLTQRKHTETTPSSPGEDSDNVIAVIFLFLREQPAPHYVWAQQLWLHVSTFPAILCQTAVSAIRGSGPLSHSPVICTEIEKVGKGCPASLLASTGPPSQNSSSWTLFVLSFWTQGQEHLS